MRRVVAARELRTQRGLVNPAAVRREARDPHEAIGTDELARRRALLRWIVAREARWRVVDRQARIAMRHDVEHAPADAFGIGHVDRRPLAADVRRRTWWR